jgi:pimeloyl-ACP methyl ester carboxylesterase
VLNAYVDAVIEQTGAEHVDLIGHSAGAGLTREYVGDMGVGKVRKLAYVGFSPDTSAPDIPMLNLWSSADLAVPGGDVEGIDNVQLTEEDHYQIATSVDSFAAIYEFFYEAVPQTLEPLSEDTSELWGNAVYFGENEPVQGSVVEAFRLDSISGQRLNVAPDYRFTTGEHGLWGPLPTSASELWEITLLENPSIPVRHFYAPFEHSSRSVRLRAIPEDGLASAILAAVPFDDQETVNMVTFFKQQSVFSARDSFVIDGVEMLTEDRAAAEDTIIAMFHFDSESDGVSGDDPVQFGSLPFMAGTDSVWEANEQEHFTVRFNQQSRVFPKWGNGVVLAIY